MINRKILALDISDYSIEALVLKKGLGKSRGKVTAYGRTVLPTGIVKNGLIRDRAKLLSYLKKLLDTAKPQAITVKDCILSIDDSLIFTTILNLPSGLRFKEIEKGVIYKAEELMPYKPQDVYFDFKNITDDRSTQEVFYAAAPIKMIDSYKELLIEAGLRPLVFDLESLGLARALFGEIKRTGQAKLLIDIGAQSTKFYLYDKMGIRQHLTVSKAGARLTKLLSKKMALSAKDAEANKRKFGLDDKNIKVKKIILPEIKFLADQAGKMIASYHRQGHRRVDEIILAGGTALMPKLDQFFADQLKLETNVGDPLEVVNDPKHFLGNKSSALLYANVIGSGKRGLDNKSLANEINLLPFARRGFSIFPSSNDRRAWLGIFVKLGVIAVLLVLAGLIAYGQSQGIDLLERFWSAPGRIINENNSSAIEFEALKKQVKIEPEIMSATTTASTTVEALPDYALEIVNTSTPKVSPPPVAETKLFAVIKKTSLGYLNVRADATLGSVKIGEVKPGTEFVIVKQQGEWYQIEYEKGKLGWVYGSYIDIIKK